MIEPKNRSKLKQLMMPTISITARFPKMISTATTARLDHTREPRCGPLSSDLHEFIHLLNHKTVDEMGGHVIPAILGSE